jgi:pimeloyl-ACP methyl ester carboxylesterase
MKTRRSLIALALLVAACADDPPEVAGPDAEERSTDVGSEVAVEETDPDASGPAECVSEHLPIVFAHGFLGSGDQFALNAMRFVSNGYCLDRIVVLDWNSLNRTQNHVGALDDLIDAVLAETGAEQVELAGHSAGGSLSYDYLEDPERAAKVAHYVHIGGTANEAPPGPEGVVPTLNLWSNGDLVIGNPGDIEGATNVMLPDVDHFSLVTDLGGFEAMYAFFNDGEAPGILDITPTELVFISGRALTLGENALGVGAAIDIYELDAETGFRLADGSAASFEADENGYWGPFQADSTAHYELVVDDIGDAAPVHYYREPFTASNDLVYLRLLPGPGSMAGALLSAVRFDDAHSVLIVFGSNRAILAGRDSLTVNGVEMATELVASAEETLIALFLFDENGNGETDGTRVELFNALPFLEGLDYYLQADEPETIEIIRNGRILRARNWPSETDGGLIVVFD